MKITQKFVKIQFLSLPFVVQNQDFTMDESIKGQKGQNTKASPNTIPQHLQQQIIFSEDILECRICLDYMEQNQLSNICSCKGNSIAIHEKCLLEWMKKSKRYGDYFAGYHSFCQICKSQINLETQLQIKCTQEDPLQILKNQACCTITILIFLFLGMFILGISIYGLSTPQFWKQMKILLWMGVILSVLIIAIVLGFYIYKHLVVVQINVVGFTNKRKPGERKVKKNQVAPLIQATVQKQNSLLNLDSDIQ